MDKKLLVIEVAGLAHKIELEEVQSHAIQSVFPAVTCTVQASFRTALPPGKHGMVANGRFFRALNRPMFWEQSARLIEGSRIWTNFRNRHKRVGMVFWQQSLGESVDLVLSPTPIHKHHGGMIQTCYSKPDGMYAHLCKRIGRPFRLQQYWGPLASWKAGEWIVEAVSTILKDPELAPDLCFAYLPSLDYDLQRKDPENSATSSKTRAIVNKQLSRLVRAAMSREYDVLIFGDYRIVPVCSAVRPNLALRKAGMMAVRYVNEMAYPDFHASRAFAMVDHEIAHVYIPDHSDILPVRELLAKLPGISEILGGEEQEGIHLRHKNSGELVIISEPGKWFAYPWWTNKREAPDFAGHVDIHNKPGYDPCELFFGWPPGSVSQNTDRIHGSHGKVGPGRDVTWASSFSVTGKPADLIELAAAVHSWLDEV
jgi:predicted AlkP superfamily pyrophosphatase or phosphodiesterase